jgi:3-deoxy-manno-octulosonate cytidylyltransferase (CMP-KDO synthetase)
MAKVVAVIPARLGSTRFPGKLLYPYHGRPLIYYVWRQVAKARLVDRLLIATDSNEIALAATEFGAEVVRTSTRPKNGTERVVEALGSQSGDIIVNVQGDCFGLKPALLDRVIRAMKQDRSINFATLARPIESDEDLFNPSVVKVVTQRGDRALWFSRFPVPYIQRPDARPRHKQFGYLAHIGVYFFRRPALDSYVHWKQSPLEKTESLEQLRILDNGGIIKVFRTRAATFDVDTPADLKKIGK